MSDIPEDCPVKPGDVLAGKYLVDRVIGVGGMGIVVAATHTVLKEKVALKLLQPEVVKNESIAARFLREAQAAVRIKSPHVARAMDVGTLESGVPFMVMEYLDGADLGVYLEEKGALDPETACLFALQACEALAAAHAAGIIHRDIKPGNLFLAKGPGGGRVIKVLDFGISKISSDIGGAALTATQVSMGSPLYMSPEQMRSARSVSARADIWSLGVVLFEMLTGTVPFNASSMPQLCALVLEGTVPSMRELRPELPEALDQVVARCLQRKPEDRYSDVGELAQALAPFAGEEGAASATRAKRIMDGAGLGKTTDARAQRDSSTAVGRPSEPPPRTGGGTEGAFGKTGATAQRPAPRRGALVWAGGAVIIAVGVMLWATRPRNLPEPVPTPEVGASTPAAPSEPAPSAPTPAAPSASAAPQTPIPSASTVPAAPRPLPRPAPALSGPVPAPVYEGRQ